MLSRSTSLGARLRHRLEPPNALVQLQARYHHCGEAGSESACQLQRSIGGALEERLEAIQILAIGETHREGDKWSKELGEAGRRTTIAQVHEALLLVHWHKFVSRLHRKGPFGRPHAEPPIRE